MLKSNSSFQIPNPKSYILGIWNFSPGIFSWTLRDSNPQPARLVGEVPLIYGTIFIFKKKGEKREALFSAPFFGCTFARATRGRLDSNQQLPRSTAFLRHLFPVNYFSLRADEKARTGRDENFQYRIRTCHSCCEAGVLPGRPTERSNSSLRHFSSGEGRR